MKIALVTASYNEEFGGNEYYLAKYFSKLGHEVFIYVSEYSPPRYGLKKINTGSKLKNVHVVRLPSFGIRKIGLVYLKRLKEHLKKDNIDVVHVQEWFMPLSLACIKHKNLIVTQRLSDAGNLIIPFNIYAKILSRFIIKNARKVTCLTTEAEQMFYKITSVQKHVTVISNGVDVDFFKPTRIN